MEKQNILLIKLSLIFQGIYFICFGMGLTLFLQHHMIIHFIIGLLSYICAGIYLYIFLEEFEKYIINKYKQE